MRVNHINEKYGKLTVLKKFKKDGKINTRYLCRCDCGNEKLVSYYSLQSKSTKSCGCIRSESAVKREAAKKRNIDESVIVYNFAIYKRNAKNRNHVWEIDLQNFIKYITSNCFYCGAEPTNIIFRRNSKVKSMLCNGIDRIDNNLGYTEKNSVTCCKICNRAKHNLSLQEFRNWAVQFSKNIGEWE